MQVHMDRICTAFKKALQIQNHNRLYMLNPERIPASIEDLQWVVQDMYDVKITKTEVNAGGTSVRGFLERTEDGKACHIVISANQNDEWKRFTTAKELAHVIMDENEDWSVDGVEIIDGLIQDFVAGINGQSQNPAPEGPLQSERIAELIATELLYPYSHRLRDAAELARGETTVSKLALYYGIPDAMADRALKPGYMNLAKYALEQVEENQC
jgi:Zn-dependent peptidase ImmA (M78 family)